MLIVPKCCCPKSAIKKVGVTVNAYQDYLQISVNLFQDGTGTESVSAKVYQALYFEMVIRFILLIFNKLCFNKVYQGVSLNFEI